MKARLQALLSHRWLPPVAILLGTLLLIGGVDAGFLGDDHIHTAMLKRDPAMPWGTVSPWDLYLLVPGDPTTKNNFKELGVAPWWAVDDFQIAFVRPLSSLLLYAERRLWPQNTARMMHVMSLVWLAVFLTAGVWVIRRFLGTAVAAGMAILLFCLDDAHLFPAFWIANRNGLVAATFALFSFLLHDSWRRHGRRAAGVAAPVLLLLGLLGAEFGLSILGFFIAYALFLDPDKPKRAFKYLIPYLIVIIAWRTAYSLMGYGVSGSDAYLDPLQRPAMFTVNALTRLPIALMGLFGVPHIEFNVPLPPEIKIYYVAVAYAWVGWVAYVLRPFFKQSAVARFLGVSAVLALVPTVAADASDRLLIIASVGGMGLLGMLIASYFPASSVTRPKGRLYSTAAAGLVVMTLFLNLVVAPISTPVWLSVVSKFMRIPQNGAQSIPNSEDMPSKTVVIVAAHDMFASFLVPVWRSALDLSVPKQTLVLTNTVDPLRVTRKDATSLELTIEAGHFNTWTHGLVRRADTPMPPGHKVTYPGMTLDVITATDDGNPVTVIATFDRPLDDPDYIWLTWGSGGYVPFSLPAVGEAKTLDIDEYNL